MAKRKHPFLFISSIMLIVIVATLGGNISADMLNAANTLYNIFGVFFFIFVIFINYHILKFAFRKCL